MKTVFFDLDGTLTDPKVGITTSIQFAMEKLNVDVPAKGALTWCIGPPLLQSFDRLVGKDRSGWLPARTLSLLGAWHFYVHPHKTVIRTRERKGSNQRKQRVATGRPEDSCIGDPERLPRENVVRS